MFNKCIYVFKCLPHHTMCTFLLFFLFCFFFILDIKKKYYTLPTSMNWAYGQKWYVCVVYGIAFISRISDFIHFIKKNTIKEEEEEEKTKKHTKNGIMCVQLFGSISFGLQDAPNCRTYFRVTVNIHAYLWNRWFLWRTNTSVCARTHHKYSVKGRYSVLLITVMKFARITICQIICSVFLVAAGWLNAKNKTQRLSECLHLGHHGTNRIAPSIVKWLTLF